MNKMPCLERDIFATLNRLALKNSFRLPNVELHSLELLNEDSST
jgi:hypothetical protein